MGYLITCARSKIIPIVPNPSSIINLSFNAQLFEIREEIIAASNIQLDWARTLPAWKLYSGTRSKLYPQISIANWNKPCIDIKILSALFGWVKHTDLLPYYNLRMTDRIDNQPVWRFWHDQNILLQLINPNYDIDLLSGDYRMAISGNRQNVAILPNIQFNDYGVQKGNWLNVQLNNLVCK